jgi:hypothetical protein
MRRVPVLILAQHKVLCNRQARPTNPTDTETGNDGQTIVLFAIGPNKKGRAFQRGARRSKFLDFGNRVW